MNLELTPDEARALELGHSWGQVSREQITRIADELVVRSTELPSSEICEFSVCSRDFQVKEALAKFCKVTEKWSPLVLLLTKYLLWADLDESDRERLYFSISYYVDWDDPDPWRKFKMLHHEFRDARLGVYGDVEELSNALFETLSVAIAAHCPLRTG